MKNYFSYATAKRGLYNKYKRDAKRRKFDWKLPYILFFSIIMQPCHYCGIEHSLRVSTNEGELNYNGIDRVDNKLGYLIDNTVPCCAKCNRMKGTLTKSEFLSLVLAINYFQTTGKVL